MGVCNTLRRAAWRAWTALQPPVLDAGARGLLGLVIALTGLFRLVLTPLVSLSWMSDHLYGALALVFGLGITLTSADGWRRRWPGRLVALLGSALLSAWALDLGLQTSPFWMFLAVGYVLFREAVAA